MRPRNVVLTPEDRETLLRAVARRARNENTAWRYLRQLGYPREALPAWTDSETWWTVVFEEFDLGRVPNPYPGIINQLFLTYQADDELRRLHQWYVLGTAPAGQPDMKPTTLKQTTRGATRGSVFISYSHGGDSAYVESLASHLTHAGVPVWFDQEIIVGNRWDHVIKDQIDACVVLIVVMTPQAEASIWVSREINYAEAKMKPIFPLLLRGEPFFRLSNIQYENVTDGCMPSTLTTTLRSLAEYANDVKS